MGSPPPLRLSRPAISLVETECRERYPQEACGALVGRVEEGGRRVIRAFPARNERRREREKRYRLGPEQVLEIEEVARREGLEIVGFFHSHPDHPARPSEYDRAHAWPWYSYLIVPVSGGEPGEARCWRLRDDRSSFDEEEILIEEEVK